MKKELGFIWTGFYNTEDPKNSTIQWKSSNTVVDSETIWDEETDEKVLLIFCIDGIDEEAVAKYLLENLEGVDNTCDTDAVKNDVLREEGFQHDINLYIMTYHPNLDELDKAPDRWRELELAKWENLLLKYIDFLDTKYYGVVIKTDEEKSDDIIDGLLK